MEKSSKPEHQIHFSQLAAYGAGGIIPIALFNIAGILVGLMGNISLGLSAFWLGAILIVPRLWDALSDPFIGHLSDNTRTRWGRRRPYLLIGGILVAVFFVVIWWIPKGDMVRTWFPSDTGFQWFQLCYILFSLLLFFTAVNLFEIPHGALGMEMTTEYHERTRLFSAKSFVGNLFAMGTPWLFALASMEIFKGPGGNEADGMRYVSLMIAAFLQLIGSYIPIFYVFGGDKVAGAYLLAINGMIWAITGVLAVFPLNWISPKLGKRNTLTIAILLMCLAQLSKIICYNPTHPYLIIIPTVLLSAGMLFFFTLGSSMVGDICDEDELKTGYRSEGSYYSVFWWFIKMGSALASFVTGVLIVFTMFDETQVTKVDKIQGSVREMRSTVKFWKDYHGIASANKEWLENTKTQNAEALKESKEYLIYLGKESLKNHSEANLNLHEYPNQKKNELLNAISTTKATIGSLEQLQSSFEKPGAGTQSSRLDSLIKEAIPLTLQTKIVKARMNSFELMSRLEDKSLETKNSKAHYNKLMEEVTGVNNRLLNLNTKSSPDSLEKELGSIESSIRPLTQQTPYTLLMMRVVEIGLPLLLSIFSIFFVLRYSLTEKRSHEIKELLKKSIVNSEQ